MTTKRFLSTGEAAELLGLSEATLYRAIRQNEFPAIKIRGRYVIPMKAIDELENLAMTERHVIDTADYEFRPKS